MALVGLAITLVVAVAAGAHLLCGVESPQGGLRDDVQADSNRVRRSGTLMARFPVEGSGVVTHVGLCTVAIDQVGVLDATAHGALAGTMTITASDGSKLIGNIAGLTGPRDRTTVEFTGDILFVEGTGQFAGSLGKARFQGSASLAHDDRRIHDQPGQLDIFQGRDRDTGSSTGGASTSRTKPVNHGGNNENSTRRDPRTGVRRSCAHSCSPPSSWAWP